MQYHTNDTRKPENPQKTYCPPQGFRVRINLCGNLLICGGHFLYCCPPF
nr:MAG TPA: hypothetical protein [Bacteriophage sp.]